MSKFHIGDRVRVIDKGLKRFKQIGVIKRFAPYDTVIVEFEDNAAIRMFDQYLEYAFQKGDIVTFTSIKGRERNGVIKNRLSDGRWLIHCNTGEISSVHESAMKPVSKEKNTDKVTGMNINQKEENKTMKAELFVTDIFKRIAAYIQKKGEEVIDTIIEEDKNWKEAQECMKKLKDLHDLYYPDKDITIDYSFGNFCSPTTMSNAQKVHERLTELLFTISRKKDLVLHALQVDENMSSEAVFKLLRSYGLTDQTGRVLPVTEELICDLLELPVDEKLF